MTKEQRSKYNREYYLRNKEKEKKRKLDWYYQNRDKINSEEKREYSRQYYRENKEKWVRSEEQAAKRNEARREKYRTDPMFRKEVKEKVRDWQANNPRKRKAQRISAYGLTMDQYEAMLESQNYECAICGYNDTENKKMFPVIDHNHATGEVRGILCANCNRMIGKAHDNPEVLRMAARYLEKTNG